MVLGCIFVLLCLDLFGYDCYDEMHVLMYEYMLNGLLYVRDMIHE